MTFLSPEPDVTTPPFYKMDPKCDKNEVKMPPKSDKIQIYCTRNMIIIQAVTPEILQECTKIAPECDKK
jgi:hypothetical protein